MSDPITWPAVADTAVKIGLGALIGGGFAVLVGHLSRLTDRKRRRSDARRALILQGLMAVIKAHQVLSDYFTAIKLSIEAEIEGRRQDPRALVVKNEKITEMLGIGRILIDVFAIAELLGYPKPALNDFNSVIGEVSRMPEHLGENTAAVMTTYLATLEKQLAISSAAAIKEFSLWYSLEVD